MFVVFLFLTIDVYTGGLSVLLLSLSKPVSARREGVQYPL